jgi:dolichol-phosphate mannosyltransferase
MELEGLADARIIELKESDKPSLIEKMDTFLSKTGTILSNLLLGTKMYDMTSGFQGFHANIVEKFAFYELLSKAHFYQTELRYLLRKTRYAEIPIHYRAPSPSVSSKSIINSINVLLHYFILRLKFQAPFIK